MLFTTCCAIALSWGSALPATLFHAAALVAVVDPVDAPAADPDYCTKNPGDCEDAAAADAMGDAAYPATDYIDIEAGDVPCEDADVCAAAAAAADAAMAAGDAAAYDEDPTPSDVWGAMEALPPARRGEMRCAMLGELVFHEYKRGVTINKYGLSGEKTEILSGAVAEAIMAEQGIGEALVRAMYKQDFEDFSSAMLGGSSDPAVGERLLDDAMATCAPLYASIKVEGDREGTVGALSPLMLPPIAAIEIEAPYCYALFFNFGDAIRQKEGRDTAESMAFTRKANRIESAMIADGGGAAQVAAALVAAVAKFDTDAFDALPEADAETIMSACDTIAGPDA
ncbi:MAG: hypothetical protein RLZZ58_2010 [Pseudomonadota bacterium]|jgi:hypothetical protein